jgi:hypothetical protein
VARWPCRAKRAHARIGEDLLPGHGRFVRRFILASILCVAPVAYADPSPTYLFDTAQTFRLRGDCEHAAIYYHAYIRERPAAGNRQDAEQFAAETDACAAMQRYERDHARRYLPPPPPPPHVHTLRDVGLVTAGLGVVTAGAGAYFGLEALQTRYRLEEMCRVSCNPAEAASLEQTRHDDLHAATVMYVAGAIAVAAGASMFAWAHAHDGSDTVVVVPTTGGAAVSTSLRF